MNEHRYYVHTYVRKHVSEIRSFLQEYVSTRKLKCKTFRQTCSRSYLHSNICIFYAYTCSYILVYLHTYLHMYVYAMRRCHCWSFSTELGRSYSFVRTVGKVCFRLFWENVECTYIPIIILRNSCNFTPHNLARLGSPIYVSIELYPKSVSQRKIFVL